MSARAVCEHAAGESLMDVGHGGFDHFEGRRGLPAALRVPDRGARDSHHERGRDRPFAHFESLLRETGAGRTIVAPGGIID